VWFDIEILILPLAVAAGSIYVVHFNLLLLCYYCMNFLPHLPLYPFSQLTMLGLYAYMVILISPLRTSVGWPRMGRFTALIWALIIITVIVSSVALVIWVQVLSPDLSRYEGNMPHFSLALMLLYGLGFCTFNAALEEITWRGVMMEALDSAFGPGACSVILQAVSFAVAHYRNGFPNGLVGSVMVLAYGLMLGFIRRKSKGILGCWLAHVTADFTIYCLIFYFMQNGSH
jgi:membrane protease YdiL (CAAX protease family)